MTTVRGTRYNGQNTEVPMRFIPIGSEFAAVVAGIDLCAPLDRLRWRRSMPAWIGMRCWCSTISH